MPTVISKPTVYQFAMEEVVALFAASLKVNAKHIKLDFVEMDISDEPDRYSTYVVSSVKVTVDPAGSVD